ncbi:MAG: patatin-like phospholipase family protein, partial [Oscillospiraceae bacterium]
IGAWQALMELGFKPDIVTGTSVGSMNATLVALDRFDDAKAMWLSLSHKDVLTMPSEISSKEILRFVKQVAADGGMNMEPLEEMITTFIDEEQLRKAPCQYGLVTVNLTTLKPMELTLDDIPEGQLIDYVMASSACFPLMKMKKIDGQHYVDGGYFDNIPSNLAAKMGATEIVEIDLDGRWHARPLIKKYSEVKMTKVVCYHDLGSILEFKPDLAQRNMDLGYLDTYKAFGKLEGTAYAFKIGEIQKLYDSFGRELLYLCDIIAKLHPTILLSLQMYLKRDRDGAQEEQERFLAILESAMMSAGIPITEIYTQELVVVLLNRAKLSIIQGKYEQLLKDTLSSRLIAPIGAANLGNVFLSLLHQLI